MAINRFSETYLPYFDLIECFLTWVTQWRSALTYISPESVPYSFSKRTPSSSCVKPVLPSHSRLCILAALFVRRNPGSQALPLLLSFHQNHVVPGSQFSPGCPGLLWLHLDQVPQGFLGHMSCMSTSRFVHHYYKMDMIEQAAEEEKI